jgi:LPXTG-motif cell wall-anchored protein
VPADPSTAAPRTDPLPVTGSPTSLVLGLGGLALAAGALVVGWTRRRADELIGD